MNELLPFDIFWEKYAKSGHFPDGAYASPNGYPTESKKNSRYKKYTQWVDRTNRKALEKRAITKSRTSLPSQPNRDTKWMAVQTQVWERDGAKCRLISLLSSDEYRTLLASSGGLHKTLDCAHIKSRGTHPALKYDIDNVVLLNRFSHSMLDSGKHPLTGKVASPEEHEYWWDRIINFRRQ